MPVQATARPRTTGTALIRRACTRCGTRLSRYNPDDVCSACGRDVAITTDESRPVQLRLLKTTPTTNLNRCCAACGHQISETGRYLPVPDRLRQQRIIRNWSQKTMAARLRDVADEQTRRGMPSLESIQRYVRWYESGHHEPGDLYAELYCRAFGFAREALFGERWPQS